jgi:class 3 adenylate cyclase
MADSTNRTLVCSIVFLDIADYSRKSVAEQLQLKQSFNDVVAKALQPVAARDRIVLDTGDGAAVTFLGDPEDALFGAIEMRDTAAARGNLRLRMGINLGPARLVRDLNGQVNIIGDGINVAQRVMSFAQTGQLLVSRSFYEVVSCLSREYAALFEYVGARTDKHVREHEVYLVGAGKRAERPAAKAEPGIATRTLGAFTAPGPFGLLRVTFFVSALVFSVIVGAAAQIKYKRDMIVAPEEPVAVAAPAVQPVLRKTVAAAPRAEPGQVQLAVLPWGEVLVNGKTRGVSPPLKVIDLPPGTHTVEIRNANFPPHVARVEVRTGEKTSVKHRFKHTP